MKYWVSLEALITGYKGGNETKRLKTAIPILLSQGSASVPSKKEVERMYKVRSNLLHGRKASRVRRSDLNKLCGWACFCIVCYLSLRERGYTTRQQIHEQAERIDRAKRRGAKM